MALLTALFATVLLMGLGLSVLLLGSAETTLASRDRDARALGHAAHAGAAVAAADLRALPSWSLVATPGAVPEVSATPGRLVDSTLMPPSPWGGAAIDLRGLTTRLQADTDAAAPSGGPAPSWRLFEYGPLARLAPDAASRTPYYLVVWVADDSGSILARAVAYGPGDGRSIVEVSVIHQPDTGQVKVLTVRPGA